MASNIFRGKNFLLSKTLDPIFMFTIGLGAATLRVRREETAHRLGLPSSSMISIIEQERNRFADAPGAGATGAAAAVAVGGKQPSQETEGEEKEQQQQHRNPASPGASQQQRDAIIRQRYKDAEPSLLELGQILTRRIRRVGGEWYEETFSRKKEDDAAGSGKAKGGGWREKWRAGSAGE